MKPCVSGFPDDSHVDEPGSTDRAVSQHLTDSGLCGWVESQEAAETLNAARFGRALPVVREESGLLFRELYKNKLTILKTGKLCYQRL